MGAAWVPPGGVGGSPALPEGAEIGLQGVCSRSGTRCHPGPTAGACQRLCCPFWLAGEGCAGLAQDLGSPWGGGHRSALRFWAAPTLSHGQVAIPEELPGSPLLCCQTPAPKPALRGGPALYPPLNPPGLRHPPPGSGGTGDLNPLRPCGAWGRAGPGGENRGRFWGGGWGGGDQGAGLAAPPLPRGGQPGLPRPRAAAVGGAPEARSGTGELVRDRGTLGGSGGG